MINIVNYLDRFSYDKVNQKVNYSSSIQILIQFDSGLSY